MRCDSAYPNLIHVAFMLSFSCLASTLVTTCCGVIQTRLKSSFIYLANAVNDLRSNWSILALVLVPLAFLAAVCSLPDALNLQHQLAVRFAPGTRNVAWFATQSFPLAHRAKWGRVSHGVVAAERAEDVKPPLPAWVSLVIHLLLALTTLTVNLVVLCALRRSPNAGKYSGVQSSPQVTTAIPKRSEAIVSRRPVLNQAFAVYRDAFGLALPFLWILLLQLIATIIGFVLLIVPGLLAIVWLYFAQYALVFDNRRSWLALLHSRDVVRKRFFKVATRVLVFLAVWSGYNSWAGGTFLVVSVLLGPIGVITGSLWAAIFVLALITASVEFATTGFFIAAGAHLYSDLSEIAAQPLPAPAT
jgi:hypothetical protein